MKKLADQELLPSSQQNEYIRTHPLSRDRVSTLEQSLQDNAAKALPQPKAWSEEHARVKAKLMGYITPQQVLWAYDDTDHSFPADYARALAAYRQNHVDEALKNVNALIAREPKNPYLYELKGQMLYDFGRGAEAVPVYAKAVTLAPNEPLINLAYAQALSERPKVTKGDLEKAAELLEQVRLEEPRISRVYRLLATVYGRLGNKGIAQAWLAEEAFLQTRYDESRRLALGARDQVQANSRTYTRLNDLLNQLDQVKDKRKK